MGTMLTKSFRALGSGALDPAIVRDADRLMRAHGDDAFEIAGMNSWREDIGLLYTATPGHWSRVRAEIGRRAGRNEIAEARGSVEIQRLHLV